MADAPIHRCPPKLQDAVCTLYRMPHRLAPETPVRIVPALKSSPRIVFRARLSASAYL
jgi:hypothetical protein